MPPPHPSPQAMLGHIINNHGATLAGPTDKGSYNMVSPLSTSSGPYKPMVGSHNLQKKKNQTSSFFKIDSNGASFKNGTINSLLQLLMCSHKKWTINAFQMSRPTDWYNWCWITAVGDRKINFTLCLSLWNL